VKDHLINQGYEEENIRLIRSTQVPKARKTFSVYVTFDNGIHRYIVKDYGEPTITKRERE